MEPPQGWIPPTKNQKNRSNRTHYEHDEWTQFSYNFRNRFLNPTHTSKTHGLQEIVTDLSWQTLVDNRRGPYITSPEGAVDTAWKALDKATRDVSTCWTAADGKKLAYYFPEALCHIAPKHVMAAHENEDDLVRIGEAAIEALCNAHPPVTDKKDAGRYGSRMAQMKCDEFKKFKTEMVAKYGHWGRYILGIWHPQGQTKKPPVMAADETVCSARAMGVRTWYRSFAPVFQAISRIFQEVDPWAYHVYRANYDHYAARNEFMKSQRVSARCCFLSTAILVNQHVLPHRDKNDVIDGWVVMTVFGDFEEGELCLPDLDCRLPFRPSDVVVFRSALLEHYVTKFKGKRYSCVFFTQDSTSLTLEELLAFQDTPDGKIAGDAQSRWAPATKRKRTELPEDIASPRRQRTNDVPITKDGSKTPESEEI